MSKNRTRRPSLPKKLADMGWRIGNPKGGGGQARVFELNRGESKLVLRIPRPKSSQVDLERFRREIRTLTSISHPNVMDLIEFDAESGTPWMVMPIGVPLDEWWSIQRSLHIGPALFDRAWELAEGILEGLAQFHDRGATHRDVKPANVIVVNGVPKLSDAGIRFERDEHRITELTERPIRRAFHIGALSSVNPSADPPQWEDCLHFSWLVAWMLLEPAPARYEGNYHWRYLQFIPDKRCESLLRPMLATCSHESLCPKNAQELKQWMLNMQLAQPQREQSFSEASVAILEANRLQRAGAELARADDLEQAEAAALVCDAVIQPIRESLWQALQPVQEASPDLIAHVTVLPEVSKVILDLVNRPMGSESLLRYEFRAGNTEALTLELKCMRPTSMYSATFPEDFFQIVFACFVELPGPGRSDSFALLVRRDGSLWRAPWPSLAKTTATSQAHVVEWFLNAAADAGRRPAR